MKDLKLAILSSALLLIVACQKNAGTGGNSTIKGRVFVQEYTSSGAPKFVIVKSKINIALDSINRRQEYFAQDQDVFIVYGDETNVPSAKVTTGTDGSYEFKYLAKGKYKIFTYGKSFDLVANPSGIVAKTYDVEITKKKSTIIVATDTIKN